jgi:uncharacterized protein
MNQENIEKLEEKIKKLYLNPSQKDHSLTNKDAKEVWSNFWFLHLKFVIDYSKKLAKKYNADLEIIWISAILHDIARLDDLEPHDEIGSEKAYNILLEEGFDKEIAEKVKNTILTHSCKRYKPQTLEQKILSTADAVSHFKKPFYLWFSFICVISFKEQIKGGLTKIEKDYNEKIFFEEEREFVRKEYEVLKNWFEHY